MLDDLKPRYRDANGKRHFLITEVTHMGSGDICVAGIDLQTQRIVRPLQWNHRNWPPDFATRGISPGRIVRQKIRNVQDPHGYPHQTEDTQLTEPPEILDDILTGEDLFRTLMPVVDPSIHALFGGNVVGQKYVVDETKCRSLGSVSISADTARWYMSNDRPRLYFSDGEGDYDLPITDLRIWNASKSGRHEQINGTFSEAARAGERLLIRAGLARGWAGSSGEFQPKRCYVQVNGVIFERAPGF